MHLLVCSCSFPYKVFTYQISKVVFTTGTCENLGFLLVLCLFSFLCFALVSIYSPVFGVVCVPFDPHNPKNGHLSNCSVISDRQMRLTSAATPCLLLPVCTLYLFQSLLVSSSSCF